MGYEDLSGTSRKPPGTHLWVVPWEAREAGNQSASFHLCSLRVGEGFWILRWEAITVLATVYQNYRHPQGIRKMWASAAASLYHCLLWLQRAQAPGSSGQMPSFWNLEESNIGEQRWPGICSFLWGVQKSLVTSCWHAFAQSDSNSHSLWLFSFSFHSLGFSTNPSSKIHALLN